MNDDADEAFQNKVIRAIVLSINDGTLAVVANKTLGQLKAIIKENM